MTPPTLASLVPAFPEMLLAAGALLLVVIGACRGDRALDTVNGIALALLLAAGGVLLAIPPELTDTFHGSFKLDAFAHFMKLLTLTGALVALTMSFSFQKSENMGRFEYAILIVLATIGMMLMISAHDLIMVYLGLELQSLSLYVLASMRRDNVRSSEAGLKYFVLGALSSGMLLYGASLVYGYAGAVGFDQIAQALKGDHVPLGLTFGLVFLCAGLAFKVSAVPFHMWTPDVYEGAPTPVTAFFAAAPKIAAMSLFVRLMIEAFPGITVQWQQIVVFISLGSMFLGAFAAIGQRNIKRLMAYSSIGHVGFALVGLAAATPEGVQGVVIYLAIYLPMTLGTFACILAMRHKDGFVEDIEDLAGLARTRPFMGFMLAMLLFSLAGIPPLAGFFAKFYVFLAAMNAGLYALSVLGVLSSVIGAYYYLRIVKIIYFDEAKLTFEPLSLELRAIIGVAGLFVLLYFLYPTPLTKAAEAAARSLF